MSLRDDDLGPDTTEAERKSLARVAATLESERPVPRALFRGQLRRQVVAGRSTGRAAGQTARRWGVASLVAGGILLASAAAGLVGLGPLAPSGVDEVIALLASLG